MEEKAVTENPRNEGFRMKPIYRLLHLTMSPNACKQVFSGFRGPEPPEYFTRCEHMPGVFHSHFDSTTQYQKMTSSYWRMDLVIF